MNILLLTSRMDIGGAETHIFALSRELIRLGHKVFCASAGGRLAVSLCEVGAVHIPLPLDRKDPYSLFFSYRAIKRIIKEHGIDVIHSHSRIPAALVAHIKKHAPSPSPSFVTTAHMPFSVNMFTRRASSWGEECIAVCEDVRRYLVSEYSVGEDNLTVIENGIDIGHFGDVSDRDGTRAQLGIDEGERVICAAARSSRSRADVLLYLSKNAPGLLFEGERILLVISGAVGRERDMRREIYENAARANAAMKRDAVIIVEGESDISRYLAASDIFVGVSRAAMEAMAAGLAVILAGNEGYGGILTAENIDRHRIANLTARACDRDISMLGNDIDMLRDERIRATLGVEMREYAAAHFSASAMAERTVAVYKRVLDRDRKQTLLVIGHYGAGNVGDDASGEVLRGALCDRYRVIYVKKRKQTLGRDDILRTDLSGIQRAARESRAVIFGCGNLIQDSTSRRSLWYYSAVLRLCRKHCKNIAIFANGIGPLTDKKSEHTAAKMLACADYISMREPYSLEYAVKLTGREDIRLGADTVLLSKRPSAESIAHTLEKHDLSHRRYFIICPRGEQSEGDTHATVELAKVKVQSGATALVIPMQRDADIALCEYIVRAVGDGAELLCDFELCDMAALFTAAEFAVGARLHSAVYALLCDTAFVGYDSDRRMRALSASAGCMSVLDSGSFDFASLCVVLEGEILLHSHTPYESRAALLCERAAYDMAALRGFLDSLN